ncbi:MAG: LytTR family DNA-binding domain-containing protein [Sporomusaceae bacterium]|nr:LytTR family DNA-binding domain-containing protein [Sporomusaceae bacterium]
MKALTAVVVDDEVVMADLLRRILEENCNTQVLGIGYDGDEALTLVEKFKPDLLFLDIQMPGQSGLEIAAQLAKATDSPLIVFVTAYDDYSLQAFSVNALDYVLKPFDEEDIQRVLQKIRKLYFKSILIDNRSRKQQSVPYIKRLGVTANEKTTILDVEKIQFICAENREVFLQTVDGDKYYTKYSLQEFEQKLDPASFFRCHRNYIVNMNEVREIASWFNRGYLLKLGGAKGAEIPVSRANTKRLEFYVNL